MVCMTDVFDTGFIACFFLFFFKDTYTYMCYSKSICTKLQ